MLTLYANSVQKFIYLNLKEKLNINHLLTLLIRKMQCKMQNVMQNEN